eukprot:scaffold62686_cov42-Phaeocystis_antarctica.AAC.1
MVLAATWPAVTARRRTGRRSSHSWLGALLISSHGGGGCGGDAGGDDSGGPAAHWPQVCAQLLWNQGRSHLCVFLSHHVLGLMSWHGDGGDCGSGGGGGTGDDCGGVAPCEGGEGEGEGGGGGEGEGGGGGGGSGPAGDEVAASHWPQVIEQWRCSWCPRTAAAARARAAAEARVTMAQRRTDHTSGRSWAAAGWVTAAVARAQAAAAGWAAEGRAAAAG